MYIDAENLRATIEKIINSIESCPFIEAEFGAEEKREGKILAYNKILALIDSLQQEQPSPPDNLDEAAKKYGHEEPILPEGYNDGDIPLYERWTADAFKAGAEWMAKQGFISEGIINQTSGEDTMIDLNEHIGYLEDCEEVIVNIRKKEKKK